MLRKRVIDSAGLLFDEELMLAFGAKSARSRGAWVYTVLWGIAEDWGGYEPNYKAISMKLGFLDATPKEVEKIIRVMIEKYKIIPYEVDGKQIHWLKNLIKHQHLKNSALPKLPLPPWVSYQVKEQEKSKRKYAVYSIDKSILESHMRVTCECMKLSREKRVSLEKETEKEKETERETETENIKGRDLPTPEGTPQEEPKEDRAFGSPVFDEEKEKKEFQRVREHLEKQCEVLVRHFNLRAEFKPGQSIKGRDFNPMGFIFYARQKRIPVAVIVKVIDSMVRQKDDISNPYGWIISVLESEYKEFSYAKELEAHEQRKKWGLSSIGNLFRGVII